MKAIVDEETCIGCGLCAETCKEAAENCPVEAIQIEE